MQIMRTGGVVALLAGSTQAALASSRGARGGSLPRTRLARLACG
jgi:hypothetical protein